MRGDTFTGSSPLTVQVDAHLSGRINSSDLDLATVQAAQVSDVGDANVGVFETAVLGLAVPDGAV